MTTLSSPGNGACLVLGALTLFVLQGCASVRNSMVAIPVDPATGNWAREPGKTAAGLIVSGEELDDYASEHFGVIDITFENTTNQWIQIKGLALKFATKYEPYVAIPVGEPLKAWATAAQANALVARHNRNTALAVVALAGMATAVASDDRAVSTLGGVVAAGSLAALGADSLNQEVQRAEHPATPQNPSYYESHLLSVPFSVPPGLFSRRWLTINTTGGEYAPCVKGVMLDYELDNGQRERVYLTFRTEHELSKWQKESCPGRQPKRAAR